MPDQIKNQLNKLKADIAEWPDDQKTSFIDGIAEEAHIVILIANEAGCSLAKNEVVRELLNILEGEKICSIRKRNKAAQKSKSASEQFFEDTKELVRRAIASRLNISKQTYDTAWDTWELANNFLLISIAIARRSALDDAIADIQITRSIAGGSDIDREIVKSEVETCYEKFGVEIASIEMFYNLSKRRHIKVEEIWTSLRMNTPIRPELNDDDLSEIDARYKNGI